MSPPWPRRNGTDKTVKESGRFAGLKEYPSIASPRMVTSEPTVSASGPLADWLLIAISGVPANQGWDEPSSMVGVVIWGRGEGRAIVWTPGPGMAKSM